MTTPNDVLTVARSLLGLGETPDGSNHNLVTVWYGFDGPWCAMDVSYCLAHGGFSGDGGNTCHVPDVRQTTLKGWAYVPYMHDDFAAAGRIVDTPAPGDIGMVPALSHTFLVESNNGDGTVTTLEGNYGNRDVRNRRSIAGLIFARPPYDGAAAPSPAPPVSPQGPPAPAPGPAAPPWPGRFLTYPPTTVGADVETWQRRMAERGWRITVDGEYGPASKAVCVAFQREKGLKPDGIVGPVTWAATWTAPIT